MIREADPREFAQRQADAQEDIEVYNQLQLQNKRVEPNKAYGQGTVNRNLNMGNIKNKQFEMFSRIADNARLQKKIPDEYGGWLVSEFANDDFNNIEFNLTMSRSIDGMNQKLLVTRYSGEVVEQPKDKALFNTLIRKKQQ